MEIRKKLFLEKELISRHLPGETLRSKKRKIFPGVAVPNYIFVKTILKKDINITKYIKCFDVILKKDINITKYIKCFDVLNFLCTALLIQSL